MLNVKPVYYVVDVLMITRDRHGGAHTGMIMWPKAKRGVSDETARQIAQEAVQCGATAVGVFVDEDAETINRR